MKKILIIINIIMFIIPTYAVDMCASNNAVTVVLDPSSTANSEQRKTYQETNTWVVTPSTGGIISGTAACLTFVPDSQIYSSGYAYSGILKDNDQEVVGGERNGSYCWCKMTHPAVSAWVYFYGGGCNNSFSTCLNGCVSRWQSNDQQYKQFRVAMYGSIKN